MLEVDIRGDRGGPHTKVRSSDQNVNLMQRLRGGEKKGGEAENKWDNIKST